MARAKRWQMTFAALDDTIYTAYIYDEGWTGSVTSLTPSANPFETQENMDEDAFIPVRTSTGYIRFIVEDLSIIDQIMCNEVDGRYVALTTGTNETVVWQGYIQAQSFNCRWISAPYEIEFPLVSCLGVLANMPYTPDEVFMCLGYAIRKACDNNYMDFVTWHTPVRSEGAVNDLSATINDRIFGDFAYEPWVQHVGYNAGMAFPPDSRRSCLSVIEEVCRYFGWTAYERGKDLYFVSVNGVTDYEYGLFINVTSVSLVVASGTESASAVTLPDVVSANNMKKFLKGYGYFEIVEQLGVPSNPVNFDISQAPPASTDINNGSPDCLYINYGDISTDYLIASATNTGDMLKSPNPTGYGCQLVRIKISDDWILFIERNQTRDDFKPALVIRHGTTQMESYFQSTFASVGRTFPGGLALRANVDYWNASNLAWETLPESAGIRILMKIKWGNKYLQNPSSSTWQWTTTESYFDAKISSGKLHGGHIILGSGGGLTIAKQPEDLFYIPVDPSLSGYITVYIYARQAQSLTSDYVVLSDIELTPYKPNDVTIEGNVDYSQNLFREASGMGGNEVMIQSYALCSEIEPQQSSDYMVLKPDRSGALETKPEIDTIQRMADMYGTPTEQIQVDVEGTDFLPYNPITIGNDNYFNASCQTNWRDNKTKLQLQKLP